MTEHSIIQDAKDENEANVIRITQHGKYGKYVTYATALFSERNVRHVQLKAMGSAISTAIQVAETLKQSVSDLHQSTQVGLVAAAFGAPARNEFARNDRKRQTPYMFIHLSLDAINPKISESSQNLQRSKSVGNPSAKKYGRGQDGDASNFDPIGASTGSSDKENKSRRTRSNIDKVKHEKTREDRASSTPERGAKENEHIESTESGQDAVTWKRGEKAAGKNRRREIRAKVSSN
uniref:Aspartyl protease family A01B putative n=1 Tax=Albugo laibachii Nc14 TaxID=890382 RepID=F0W231_9STRA|nr:aspartyl protease family A01B putative [Albugo laibachii Nc14]|eukprot:CCA15110.1 aspartyl protease family A01B putative [Albugo laibachii Nc14]